MSSVRKLNRRLLRWRRYADRVAFNPRINQPWAWQPPRGYQRAAKAVEREQERRFWDETPEIWLGGPAGEAALLADVLGCCDVCGLPDLHRGDGDGIGSCDCPRCDCGAARSSSFCTCDPACSYCLSTTCEDDCDEPDDDAGHGDDWPADVIVPVENTTAFREAGLL